MGDGGRVERRGPIFLVGSMRSGSTMLRLILDSHPDIAIPGETGFMGGLSAVKDIPLWMFGRGWYRQLGWSEQEMDERLHDFYVELFERYAASQGKPRWGEKTPFHTEHIAGMAQVFPEAVFVGIVRHPGAVAASLRTRFHYTFPDALTYWSTTNLAMVDAGSRLGDRFAVLRYEDLVSRAEPVLREVVSHVDVPWSDGLVEHHRVQRDKRAPRAVEGSTITSDPIDAGRAVQWHAQVSEAERSALQDVSELAGFFGYDVRDPEPRTFATRSDDGSDWLVTGEGLARRRKAAEGRLSFSRPRSVVPVDADPQQLARDLARTEAALARARSRRAIRVADAVRRARQGRSLRDLGAALRLLRRSRP